MIFTDFYINNKKVTELFINGKQVLIGGEHEWLCFTANTAGSTISMQKNGSARAVNLKTSVDGGSTWQDFTVGSTTITLANVGDSVYFKANGSNVRMATGFSDYNHFVMTGSISASGNVNSLLEEDEEIARTMSLSGKDLCYSYLFEDCASLTTPPELPATTLAQDCYLRMFYGCTSLTTAPELPATTLAAECYNGMFEDCASLTTPPELPATTLAGNCYTEMFRDCTSLTTAPTLTAQTLADYCYQNMFNGCTSLTSAPALPATTLVTSCYNNMFRNCASLTTAPELPATTLANYCYSNMFYGCSSLKVSNTQVTGGVKFLDIPSGTTTKSGWNTNMFANTGGSFKGAPAIGTAYYYYT